MEVYATGAAARADSKLLVFAVDDAFLGLHLDWVEAVYPRATTEAHSIKVGDGRQPFLLHRGEPAFVVEPRVLFHLPATGEGAARASYLVLRSGSQLLALGIDLCIGVEELDLRSCPPIPTALAGDGGVPVGHLVDLHGRIVVVLDPNRLIDGPGREALAQAARQAADYVKREDQLSALWQEIRRAPSASNLRRFGGLCRRNGRPKTARAVRAIGKAIEEAEERNGGANGAGEAGLEGDFLAAVTRLWRHARSGELVVAAADGADCGRVALVGGRLIDAVTQRAHGTAALGELIGRREVRLRFLDSGAPEAVSRFADGTVACLIGAAARWHGERGPRG
jgi:chemotaxis signal transduction protein